ncbi:MAG: hypothetical protein KC609_18495, partial [Myxococcales bacterium]|nr:hypothetical protein [Myxococcales bacterium]
ILQMPWIRFREPQGLEAENGRLSALFVSSPLRIGEAKAIWGEAMLRFVLADVTNQAATIRDRGQAELERGLLVRLPVEQFNRTHVHPPIGRSPGSVTSMKTNYLLGITSAHNATVGYPVHPQITEPGQWAHFFSYGSQLWPDLPENAWTLPDHKNPFEYAPAANLGSPITAELLEFYRTGDPKWVWDVALPLARLMIFTAAYNKGPTPSALNGLVPSDSGSGEGDWHRLAEQFGWERAVTSNDALRDAYLVRPDPLFIDRFGVAAYTSIDFYPVLEAARAWFQAVELFEAGSDDPASALQLFEVLESLENCAEFVPGPRSGACLDELERLFGELEADNLTTGMPCNGEKKPPDDGTCGVTLLGPILWNAWPTLHRYVTTLAKNPTPWRTMLVNFSKEVVKNLVQTSGTNLVVGGYWPYSLDCTIVGGKASDCVANPTGDFQIPSPYYPNILGFVGAMRAWDPTIVDCPTYVGWLATPKLYDGFVNETKDKYGYDGFSGLALHQVIFAVGALDECLAQ